MTDAVPAPVGEKNPGAEIHRFFRGLIASGSLGAGERLPTVRQAAADFGVAPGTVQKAYRALEADGLVVSRTGSGTRVAPGVAAVSATLARQLRAVTTTARAEGADLETVADVLRVLWEDAQTS